MMKIFLIKFFFFLWSYLLQLMFLRLLYNNTRLIYFYDAHYNFHFIFTSTVSHSHSPSFIQISNVYGNRERESERMVYINIDSFLCQKAALSFDSFCQTVQGPCNFKIMLMLILMLMRNFLFLHK